MVPRLPETRRVAPQKVVKIGKVSVGNKTANSILVRVDAEKNVVEVTDCCLEEQGK